MLAAELGHDLVQKRYRPLPVVEGFGRQGICRLDGFLRISGFPAGQVKRDRWLAAAAFLCLCEALLIGDVVFQGCQEEGPEPPARAVGGAEAVGLEQLQKEPLEQVAGVSF